jgi:DNA modification methylase
MESDMLEPNTIYCGDCKDLLKKLPDESVDLIYLDPPFFSQKNYEDFWIWGKGDHETKMEFSDKDWEKLRNSIDPNILREYEHIEERWRGGHKGLYVYIAYMRERLIQCERVLKKTGSIYLHCDWHAGHYLKEMMDDVFGYDKFRAEIIWKYFGPTSTHNNYPRKHDTILFYTKGNKWTFHQDAILVEYDKKAVRRYDKVDKQGKRYKVYYTKDGKERKAYMREGRPTEVFNVPFIQGTSKEKIGYPTQKPEALLEIFIKASSNPTDLVLDPFCGCGTTLVVAKRLGRRWIGIDISRVACDVMKKRLGGDVKVVGGETKDELAKMNPHEFARLVVVEKMGGIANPRKTGDMGIDGWIDFKTIPVQVKRWEHKVGRPKIDKFAHAVERDKKEKGIIVANDFSKDCYSEVARIEKEHKIKIELKKVDDIFKD